MHKTGFKTGFRYPENDNMTAAAVGTVPRNKRYSREAGLITRKAGVVLKTERSEDPSQKGTIFPDVFRVFFLPQYYIY